MSIFKLKCSSSCTQSCWQLQHQPQSQAVE